MTTVGIYIVIHLLTYIICIKINSRHLINADKELNKKYECFARTDIHKWSLIKSFPCKPYNQHVLYLYANTVYLN